MQEPPQTNPQVALALGDLYADVYRETLRATCAPKDAHDAAMEAVEYVRSRSRDPVPAGGAL